MFQVANQYFPPFSLEFSPHPLMETRDALYDNREHAYSISLFKEGFVNIFREDRSPAF